MYGLLIDMDGVIYRGNELIEGADRFVNDLLRLDVPFRFLTNNSQRTQLDVVRKLSRLGIHVDPSHVFTCAMATAQFVSSQRPDGTAYVLGDSGLMTALHDVGYAIVDKDPDYVIVGEGRTFTFEMLEAATNMILNGAKLIATNLDPNCPTQSGTRPGCGAIVAMLETATGINAFSVGKPSPIMMRAARKELDLDAKHTFMIGDTMETDVLGGIQLGYITVLTLSGGTQLEDLSRYCYQPQIIVGSVAELDAHRFIDAIKMPKPLAEPEPGLSYSNGSVQRPASRRLVPAGV